MTKIKHKILFLLLFPLGMLLTKLFLVFPAIGENFYSTGINKYFIMAISHIWGVLPFSVFEILIYLSILLIVGYTLYTFINLFTHFSEGLWIVIHFLLNITIFLSIVYILFLLTWGLNYKRPSFADSYDIKPGTYTTKELGNLYAYFLKQAGRIREDLPEDEQGVMKTLGDPQDIFKRAQAGYDVASKSFPKLKGSYGKAKPILSSYALNPIGITGIYSPFTGEPNVNTSILDMDIPATTTHEMAHQRGYAFEDECNFIAYLVCCVHPDVDFQYSGYILAIAYTSNALAEADLPLLQQINTTMSDKVFADLTYHNRFWSKYNGDAQEVSDQINSAYLQANGVAAGTKSYGQVVDLLLAYYDNKFE